MEKNKLLIIDYLSKHTLISSKEVYEGISIDIGYATVKRLLGKLKKENFVETEGQGRSTRYKLSSSYALIKPVDVEDYFLLDIDDRVIRDGYNFELIPSILQEIQLFTTDEMEYLDSLQATFTKNIQTLSEIEYQKELERLAIDLSWKSSQIEGNTYSLLETERLLKEKLTAEGKNKDEAIMLLNHKEAIDFIVEHPDYLIPISVRKIKDIHSILTKELDINRNIRNRRVGISGTNYIPLDNEFQIREALQQMCNLVNTRPNIFDKTFLLLILLSYIQDGKANRRLFFFWISIGIWGYFITATDLSCNFQ